MAFTQMIITHLCRQLQRRDRFVLLLDLRHVEVDALGGPQLVVAEVMRFGSRRMLEERKKWTWQKTDRVSDISIAGLGAPDPE